MLKYNILNYFFFQEPGNIPCLSSFKYSGIVQPKSVHITIPQDNRGFVVRTKKPGSFVSMATFQILLLIYNAAVTVECCSGSSFVT